MDKPFQTIALIGKYTSSEIDASLYRLAQFLEQAGYQVLLASETAARMPAVAYPTASFAEIGVRADLVVILGGDGTMLHVARAIGAYDVPMVGINQGRLGFLTDILVDDMLPSLTAILNGEFLSEDRFLLNASIMRANSALAEMCAFNDVVVSKGATGRLIEIEVLIDGQFVYSQRLDGLIVATPTGSTAYALSAGGPILHPTLEAVALVPVCPHTLSNRPIAVNRRSEIEIVVIHADDAGVHFDGQSRFDLQVNDRVRVRRSPHRMRLLHPQQHSYFDTLRQKLHWGEKL